MTPDRTTAKIPAALHVFDVDRNGAAFCLLRAAGAGRHWRRRRAAIAYEEKRAKARVEKLQKARRSKQPTALTTYAWVDKNKGVVRIPINDAMKLTVAELAQRSPAPANPIVAEVSPAPQVPPRNASPTPAAHRQCERNAETCRRYRPGFRESKSTRGNQQSAAGATWQPAGRVYDSGRCSAIRRGQGAGITFRNACTLRAGNALAGSRENAMNPSDAPL